MLSQGQRKRTARTFKEPEEASNVKLCRCLRVKDKAVLEQKSYRETLKLFKLGRSYYNWL